MLKALDVHGRPVVAWAAGKGFGYFCPECSEPVVLKQGVIVIHHFAHRPDSACQYGVGESLRHMAMKFAICQLFPGSEIEMPVVPGRRADVALAEERVVVECQASGLSIPEWSARTKDYNRLGYGVLWVWASERAFEGTSEWRKVLSETRGFRVPSEVRYAHQQGFGRIYVLDEAGNFAAAHLARMYRSTLHRVAEIPLAGELRRWQGKGGFILARHPDPPGWCGTLHVEEWFKPKDDPRFRAPLRPSYPPALRSEEVWWKP